MRRVLQLGLAVLGVVAFAQPAAAFCGSYVTKADTQLFNKASQVVLVRDAVAGVPAAYAESVIDNTLAMVATVVTSAELLEVWSAV